MSEKTFPLDAAALRQLAERFPTPFYLYDEAAMRANARRIRSGSRSQSWLLPSMSVNRKVVMAERTSTAGT